MSVVIIVGAMGEGKSTLLKEKFLLKSKREKLCYALMKKDLGNYEYIMDFTKFVDKAVTKSDMLFVVDEGRTCIPSDKRPPEPSNPKRPFDKKLITWLLNSRKCNNMVFIVFHSLREIPLWLLMYTHYILRFNTRDQMNRQIHRFTSFPNLYDSIENFPSIEKYCYDEISLK